MNFRENKKLKADFGDMSKLCPVTTLKEYLESTANESTRKFRPHASGFGRKSKS